MGNDVSAGSHEVQSAGVGASAIEARLSAWLESRLGRPVAIPRLKQYPSGFSWITYGLAIDAPGIEGITDIILRIGPSNGLYAPYSAEPQFAALRAVQGSAVPAPRGLFWSDDPAILGDPFFLSEKSQGEAPIPWGNEDGLGDAQRETLGRQFADILGALHAIDWTQTDLAKFGAGATLDNAAALQIDIWEADHKRRALRPQPMLNRAFAWLRANLPRAERLAIVHGDYRLGNFLAVGDSITAMLDWELVHIGDPHEDLAWVCLPQYRSGTPLMSKLIARDELYARHEAQTGVPVDETSMRFYTIFSLVKLVITHAAGVYAFECNGFHDLRMAAIGTQIAPTLRQIEKLLETVP